MKSIVFIIFLIAASQSFACSPIQRIEEFQIGGTAENVPAKPNLKIETIDRSDGAGSHGTCSDLAFITLKILNTPTEETGYLLRITDGEFKDGIFPNIPVNPTPHVSQNMLSFPWSDLNRYAPIEASIEIIAVSKSGAKSEAAYLKMSNPGVNPWWKFWN